MRCRLWQSETCRWFREGARWGTGWRRARGRSDSIATERYKIMNLPHRCLNRAANRKGESEDAGGDMKDSAVMENTLPLLLLFSYYMYFYGSIVPFVMYCGVAYYHEQCSRCRLTWRSVLNWLENLKLVCDFPHANCTCSANMLAFLAKHVRHFSRQRRGGPQKNQ